MYKRPQEDQAEAAVGQPPATGADHALKTQAGPPLHRRLVRSTAAASFQPTPELIQREISIVLEKQLSGEIEYWVARYAEVGRRNPYLWRWCRQGVEITTLSCVPAALRDEVCDTKLLGVMLDVLLDDVADQQGDPGLLEYLLAVPHWQGDEPADMSQLSASDRPYAQLTSEVWAEIQRRLRNYPNYAEFHDLLQYDYMQLFNTMRYSYLLNRIPSLLNLAEHDLYLPHNMHMIISATIDLMVSSGFDRNELGRLREAICHAQYMGRIGNLITTWQRELKEGDYTSGVFARAVAYGDLTLQDLLHGNRSSIEMRIQQGGHEASFLCQWSEHRQYLLSPEAALNSVDLPQLVHGLERLLCLHLGSRGFK